MVDLTHALHDLVMRLDRDAESRLAALGLTLRRYVALTIIVEHPGITSRQLAVPLAVSEPATSQLVSQLVGKGIVRDGSGPGTGNVRAWEATADGVRLFRDAQDRLGGDFDAVVRRAGVDPEKLAHDIVAITNQLDRPSEES